MPDPWSFGWNQLLTIVGFLITAFFASLGFRTFKRWKRERIEEKKIQVAIDALALAYESRLVFEYIRSPISYAHEWQDMPEDFGRSEDQRKSRGPFFATLKRIESNRDFFQRAWNVQVQCMAILGSEIGEIFLLMQQARREIEVAAKMLLDDPEPSVRSEDNERLWKEMRVDVWANYGKAANIKSLVEEKLFTFQTKIEYTFRPIVAQSYEK